MTYKLNDPCPRLGCTGKLYEASRSMYIGKDGVQYLCCTHCQRLVSKS